MSDDKPRAGTFQELYDQFAPRHRLLSELLSEGVRLEYVQQGLEADGGFKLSLKADGSAELKFDNPEFRGEVFIRDERVMPLVRAVLLDCVTSQLERVAAELKALPPAG